MLRSLAILLGALLIAGCGDDGGPPSAATGTDMETKTVPQMDAEIPPPLDAVIRPENQSAIDAAVTPDAMVDSNAPRWPDASVILHTAASNGDVIVSWPAALDDVGVRQYRVAIDGVAQAPIPASQTTTRLIDFQADTRPSVSVKAQDAAGNLSPALMATISIPDLQSPTWANGASIVASNVTDSTVTLGWTSSTDNVGVSRYEIRSGDAEIAQTMGETNITLEGLAPWTEYQFTVWAIDSAANESQGPSIQIRTADLTGPTWPDGSVMESADLTSTGVTINWPQASDDVGVSGYHVYQDGVRIARVEDGSLMLAVDSLTPGTGYSFTVMAHDPAGNSSDRGLTLNVSTLDVAQPTWSDGARLMASNITANSLSLGWAQAFDDVAVARYRLTQDGAPLAAVMTTDFVVDGLSPWTEYRFSVTAEDASGNGTPPLEITVRTADEHAPVWSADATLSPRELTDHDVRLTWPHATDDVRIETYRVYQDGMVIATVGGLVNTYMVNELASWTEYTFRVEAVDPAGNRSVDDLEVTVQTLDEHAPTWPGGTVLSATQVTETGLVLNWRGARDGVGVVGYRVFQDETVLGTVDENTRTFEVGKLSPWTTYIFRVEAKDRAENWSGDRPSLTIKTPDLQGPSWVEGSELTITDLQPRQLILTWPQAEDNFGVERYTIAINGETWSTETKDTNRLMVTGLNPWSRYVFTVVASDPAGKKSPSLTIEVTTPDGGPPTWPADAYLRPKVVGPHGVQLEWSEAADDVEVTQYQIYQDGQLVKTVVGNQTTIDGLTPETRYSFKVEAGDLAGHWSNDGPSFEVGTESDTWTNEQVYSLLKKDCVGCHSQGENGYFATLETFENTIVYNPRFVVPGNPDQSVLVKLLEGTNTGTYSQMPLSTDSFAQLEANGDTLISMANIRKWIQFLGVPPVADVPEPDGALNERKRMEHIRRTLYDQLGLDDSDFFATTRISRQTWIDIEPETPCLATTFLKDYTYALVPADAFYISCVSDYRAGFYGQPVDETNMWLAMGGPDFRSRIKRTQSVTPDFLMLLTQVANAYCHVAVKKDDNEAFFKYATSADTSAGSADSIRRNIANLYLRLLGDVATDAQLDRLMALFQQHEQLAQEDGAQESPSVVAWTAVCSTMIRSPLWLTY